MEAKDPDNIIKGFIVAPWIDEQPNLAEQGIILEEPKYIEEKEE